MNCYMYIIKSIVNCYMYIIKPTINMYINRFTMYKTIATQCFSFLNIIKLIEPMFLKYNTYNGLTNWIRSVIKSKFIYIFLFDFLFYFILFWDILSGLKLCFLFYFETLCSRSIFFILYKYWDCYHWGENIHW